MGKWVLDQLPPSTISQIHDILEKRGHPSALPSRSILSNSTCATELCDFSEKNIFQLNDCILYFLQTPKLFIEYLNHRDSYLNLYALIGVENAELAILLNLYLYYWTLFESYEIASPGFDVKGCEGSFFSLQITCAYALATGLATFDILSRRLSTAFGLTLTELLTNIHLKTLINLIYLVSYDEDSKTFCDFIANLEAILESFQPRFIIREYFLNNLDEIQFYLKNQFFDQKKTWNRVDLKFVRNLILLFGNNRLSNNFVRLISS